MILYDKIKKNYTREEIESYYNEGVAKRIWDNIPSIAPHRFFPNLDIEYSFKDFKKDYSQKYHNYRELELLYNMITKGYSCHTLKKQFNLQTQFQYFLRNGFNFNSNSINLYKTFYILGIEIDLTLFFVEAYKTHIELFGEENDLINFKNKYRLKENILYEPYKKSWHLAFSGCLAEYIKEKTKGE